METARLRIPTDPRRGPTTVRRNCINNRATCCIYLPTLRSPNTGLRFPLFRNSVPRWTYACSRTAIAYEDRPGLSPTSTPVPEEEEECETPTLRRKALFYFFAETALCYLMWAPSENILRFVFIITSSTALASVEFFRKFVREHIRNVRMAESQRAEMERTLASDYSRTASPSSSLEFRQGPNLAIEYEMHEAISLHPKVWFYLFIVAAVIRIYYFNPCKIEALLAFAITSSTSLGCVEFFGKFVDKNFYYLRLRIRRRKLEASQTSQCSITAFPSSSIEFRPGPYLEDEEITTCERKSSMEVGLALPVVSFFLVIPFCTFVQLVPSLVALCYSLWTPSDEILAFSFIVIPGLLTMWVLSVKHFIGRFHGVERERPEYVKLKSCRKPQKITEAERTLANVYSRTTFLSSFSQDKHVSGPTTKEDYETNRFKRILLILFCLGVPVLFFYFFLVTILDALQYGKTLLHPVALCYSLWTPSGVTLRALFPITSFLAMALVGFFRIVLQEHLQSMQKSIPGERRVGRKEVKDGKLLQ